MTLNRLHGLVAAEGGPLAEALGAVPAEEPAPLGALAAGGPRTRDAADDYALAVESIFEGYLAHYATGRLITCADADLRLLAGDYLYALGLSRLAQIGDLEAVCELGDLISLSAQVHAAKLPAAAERRLAGATWGLCTLAVACGGWPEHAAVKQAVRDGAPDALERVESAAGERATRSGLAQELERALIGFEQVFETPIPNT